VLQEKGWKISDKNITDGLKKTIANTGLMGRWQIINTKPKVICDTAHNKDGLAWALAQLVSERFKRLHIVLGVVSDKDLGVVLPLFPKDADYYFCKPDIPRGMDA